MHSNYVYCNFDVKISVASLDLLGALQSCYLHRRPIIFSHIYLVFYHRHLLRVSVIHSSNQLCQCIIFLNDNANSFLEEYTNYHMNNKALLISNLEDSKPYHLIFIQVNNIIEDSSELETSV